MIRPVVSFRDWDSNLEVNLIIGLDMGFALSDFINILQEEGADILSATCHHVGDRAIYTILSQAIYPRIGIATSSVHERLKSLIC
ncbi:transcription factor bHLH168-like [Hibiscus syriacus]|uniref:transcription factor bHLH168-like n=1 Tax=Hibiscus syriacus TaxID=106335 RepID=UPI001922B2ED|nr:transcription factor bHLH168-like [Hibiscus syriacus]